MTATTISEPLPIRELPAYLQRNIAPLGNERTRCWLWTGIVRAARSVAHRNMAAELRTPSTRGRKPENLEQAELPLVYDKDREVYASAHRVVYSRVYCVPVETLPHFRRCTNDLCVSPFHNLPKSR